MDLSWAGWDTAWGLCVCYPLRGEDGYLLTNSLPYCSKEIQLPINSSATLSFMHLPLVLKSREA